MEYIMNLFNKHPLFRLSFVGVYFAFAAWMTFKDFAWGNIPFGILMLSGCYFALVKSGIVKDKRAGKISNLAFDLLSCLCAIALLGGVILALLK